MAGASLAAALSAAPAAPRILLLEAEDHPGYHATGRSAAFWTESYGGPLVQPLTTASGPVLHALGVLRPRGALTIARQGQEAALDDFVARFAALGVRVARLDQAAMADHIPGLRAGWVAGAMEPDCCDIDVAALRLRKKGGHGGHNGMRSIVASLGGSQDFPRLRLGIGRPQGQREVVDHVLTTFGKAEATDVDVCIAQAGDAVRRVLTAGLDMAMNELGAAAAPAKPPKQHKAPRPPPPVIMTEP